MGGGDGCVTRSAGIIPSPGTPGEGKVGVFFDKLTWFSGFPPPQPSPGVPGEGEIGYAGTVTHPEGTEGNHRLARLCCLAL